MIAATLISLLLPFAQSASPPSHSMLMADDPIPVMVLGTFHFHQTETPDIRTPANQKALHAIVATLSEFSPTMIGLECTSDLEDDINAAYAAWQAGDGEMTRNERQQLGFRLAEANGLDVDQLMADMESEPVRAHIQDNIRLAQSLGISGTPSFVVGETLLPGAVPLAALNEHIDAERSASGG